MLQRLKIIAFIGIGLGLLSARADDAPPPMTGNPGVPGLLAEIADLESELAATEAELSETEAELSATENELTLTQTSLAGTQAELQITQDDLNVTNALLDETLDALEREQNRYRVPQTGQTACWDALSEDPDDPHFTIPCAGTGQDADSDAGLAPPLDRFVENGDGTISDKFTGLVWLAETDCANTFSWKDALTLANNLTGTSGLAPCGLLDGSNAGDWRLPNVNELLSRVDYDSAGYSGDWFWSATTWALPSSDDPSAVIRPCFSRGYGQSNWDRFNDAYVVNLSNGQVTHVPKQQEEQISRRHNVDTDLGGCIVRGFRNGTPDLVIRPKFIAVRDAVD